MFQAIQWLLQQQVDLSRTQKFVLATLYNYADRA
jgi:hypothetical protein